MKSETVSREEFEALKANTVSRKEFETLKLELKEVKLELAQLWDWVAELEPQVRGLTTLLIKGVQHVKNIMYSKSQVLQLSASEWMHQVHEDDSNLFQNAFGKLEHTVITADQSKRPVRSK